MGLVPEIKLNLSQLVSIRIIFGLRSVGLVHSVMCSSNNQSGQSLLKSAERERGAESCRYENSFQSGERGASVCAVNGAIVVAGSTRDQIRLNLSSSTVLLKSFQSTVYYCLPEYYKLYRDRLKSGP